MKNKLIVGLMCFLLFLFASSYPPFVRGFDALRVPLKHVKGSYSIKRPKPSHRHTPTPTPQPTAQPTSSPLPTVTPTPIPTPRAIPHGNVLFLIRAGNQKGPAVIKGSIDPYDPDYGAIQKIQVYTSTSQPDQSMNITLKTDNYDTTIPMSIATISGSFNIWEGTWTVIDSYLHTYKANIEAVGANGVTTLPIMLR